MVELSAQYPRYGYRRIAIFLGRDGHAMSFGRAYRLWRSARLQVPRKRPRKRIATGRPRPNAPSVFEVPSKKRPRMFALAVEVPVRSS